MYHLIVKYKNCFLLSLLLAVGVVFVLNSCKDETEKEEALKCQSFTPPRGTMNTPVILYGAGFGTDPEAVEVRFNNLLAEVVKCENNELIVLTPQDPGTSCDISVKKGKFSEQFQNKFTYVLGAQICDSFEPLEGLTGTPVTLKGKYFSDDPTAVEVKFNDKVAQVVSCKDDEIVVLTPEKPGEKCYITLTTRGIPVQFKKTFAYYLFTLATFSPATAEAGETVSLTGNGFGNDKDVIDVRFNDKPATVVSCTDTKIEVLVPEDPGIHCNISVKKEESAWLPYPGTFSYVTQFNLTTFDPTEGGTGTRISLYGDKFGTHANEVHVWFGENPATVVSCHNDRIEVLPLNQEIGASIISVEIGSLKKYYSASFNYFTDLRLTSFSPLEGGIGDRITLRGYNMGTDPANLEVKFNDEVVDVLNCYNDSVWVRIPNGFANKFETGDECTVTVAKGSESGTYSDKFTFVVSVMVTTVAGNGTGDFTAGTLTTAIFNPKYLLCDLDDNLIVVIENPHAVILIDQKNNEVKKLMDLTDGGGGHVPCIDPTGRNIFIPTNNQGGGDANLGETQVDFYYKLEYDPVNGWTGKGRTDLIRPTAEEQAAGIRNFRLRAFHQGYAYSPVDNKIYYRSNQDGGIVRFDPVTSKGEWARTILLNEFGKRDTMFMLANPDQVTVSNNVDGYNPRGDARIAFSPKEPWMLYGTINQTHRIGYLNILTGESDVYAGPPKSEAGFVNGFRTTARFNGLQQIAFDNDGNMIIAEAGGNRIRKIDYVTGMVSTLIGTNTANAGASGYVDGPVDQARLNNPMGVAVGKDGAIYIADRNNGRIRKL